MTYIPSLHQVQLGLEAAYGDGAAGGFQLPGILNMRIEPKVEAEQLQDKRGTTMPAHESFIKRRWSEGVLEGYLNYQDAVHYLNSMFGDVAPVGNVSTWVGSLDWAGLTEQSLSLRYGQTGLLYMCAGVLPMELEISGASGEPLKFSYRFFGQPVVDGATFAAISDESVEWAKGIHSAIYLDAGAASAPGTTPMTDLGFRFNMKINCGRKPLWHLGNQTPDAWSRGKWGGSCSLVLEADAALLAHLGNIIDATVTPITYAVRVRTTDASNILDLDFVGTAVTPPNLITDTDGVVTAELNLLPTYGSNAGILSCWAAELTVP